LLALSGLRDPKEMFDRELGRDGHDRVSTFFGYYMIEPMNLWDYANWDGVECCQCANVANCQVDFQ
jgi:hypothetical protein